MFERFTDRARRVVVLAQEEARMLQHNAIGTEHLLLGLISEGEGVAAQVLQALDVSLDEVRAQVGNIIGRGEVAPSGQIPFTPRAKKVLELSLRESLNLGHNYIGSEHILLGLLREGEGVAAQVLVLLGADLNRVRQETIALLSGRAAPEQGSRRAFWRRRRLAGAAPGDVAYESEPAGMLDNGLERLTDGVLRAVLGARAEVRRLGATELEPEHLLAGLLVVSDDPAAAALHAAGVTPDAVRGALDAVAEARGEGDVAVPALAPGTWQALASAELHAPAAPIDTIALLTALLEVSAAARLIVTSAGGDLDALRAALRGEESTGG